MCLSIIKKQTLLDRKRGRFTAYKVYRKPIPGDVAKLDTIFAGVGPEGAGDVIALDERDQPVTVPKVISDGQDIFAAIHVFRARDWAESFIRVGEEFIVPVTCYGVDVVGSNSKHLALAKVNISQETWDGIFKRKSSSGKKLGKQAPKKGKKR